MNNYFKKFQSIQPIEVMPGFLGRFIHTESLTLAYWEIEEGAILPSHKHPHEQVTQLLEGDFEMTVDNHYQKVESGQIVTIPSNILHEGKAISKCKIFDIFSPVRQDYKALTK